MSPTLVEDGVWASISYSCHSGMIFERKGTGRALLQHLATKV